MFFLQLFFKYIKFLKIFIAFSVPISDFEIGEIRRCDLFVCIHMNCVITKLYQNIKCTINSL